MKKQNVFTVLIVLVLTLWFLPALHFTFGSTPSLKDPARKEHAFKIGGEFGNIPLYFIPNRGQMNRKALFYAHTTSYTLWLTKRSLVFDRTRQIGEKFHRDVSQLVFLKANQNPVPVPETLTTHRINYFRGIPRTRGDTLAYTNIPTSQAVGYKGLYRDIDLKVYGLEKQIEYDWIVKPGGNPTDICFRCQGVKKTAIDKDGNLMVHTDFGQWNHQKPLAYQVINGKQHVVDVVFKKKGGKNTYGFKVGQYHKDYELIIDPLVVAFSSHLGGNDDDGIKAITVNGSGSIYAAGYTRSTDFPILNGYQETLSGSYDVFVTKFSPDGKSLVFSTFLGGSSIDKANGIDLDSSGAVYVAGETESPDFPLLYAYQSTYYGDLEGFIAKLSADGSTLLYSTYLGGTDYDLLTGIAVNSSGEVYAAGHTFSTDFPVQNALQSTMGNGFPPGGDAFITRLASSGSSLIYSTFLGGSNMDMAQCLTLDSSGAIYVAGGTASSDFPTVNALQPGYASTDFSTDGFIAKISPDGSSLVYSTYLGGTNEDMIYDIDLNSSSAVYVCGSTFSSDFPVTPGAFMENKTGDFFQYNAFITKLTPAGSGLVYSTYLNGSYGDTEAGAITVNSNGNAVVTGKTDSYDFPMVDPIPQGGTNYITEFSADGSSLNFSSFLEFSTSNGTSTITVDSSGALYTAGTTNEQYFEAYKGYQPYNRGYDDGFIEKWVYCSTNIITVTAPNGGETWPKGSVQDITWTAPESVDNVKIEYYAGMEFGWVEIIESTPNTGTYSWTIPDTPSPDCLVKIADADEPGPVLPDESDSTFTIPPSITVFYPNGGETLYSTNVHEIIWSWQGMLEYVSIDYSIDGGDSWIPVASSIANTGSYAWKVPDIASVNCLIRVSDPPGISPDTSDEAFTIRAAGVTITSPNGGESWPGGTLQNITWTDTTGAGYVMLEKSIDNGQSWDIISFSEPNNGSFGWTVPNTPSGSCLVRIEAGGEIDSSDLQFTITQQPTVTVTAPNGGENWEVGSQHNITWTNTGIITNVQVEYYDEVEFNWYTISNSAPNTGSYAWTVPNTPGSNFQVRVMDVLGSCDDSSDAVFTIAEPRTITVTTPNGGENWEGGFTQTITWTYTGIIPNVNLEYSTDNGTSWNIIAASVTNTGSYNWTVSNTPSGSCLVKVSDPASAALDVSDAVFTILEQRTVTVTAPNGGEDWQANSAHDITWITTGAIGTVSIEYSTDSGSTWNSITASTGNTGSYSWTPPENPSPDCLVKISDTAGPALDTSDAVFTLSPPSIPQTQRDALIALYNSTDGDNWTDNTNWRKPGDPGQFNDPGTEYTWYGITCNGEKNQVLDINLFQNGLVGTIPDLSNLTELVTLNLGNNSLINNIPVSLNYLTQLTMLNLKGNQLSGTIPDLGNLVMVTEIDLSGNILSGNIPTWLNTFTNLTGLNLANNVLSGIIPDLSGLTALTSLNLSTNQLTGNIPAWLNSLNNLTVLDLHENQLEGTIPDLGGLIYLNHFNLVSNLLTGEIPGWIDNLTNLQEIFLDSNSFSGELPDLGNLTQVQTFSAANNDLTGSLSNLTSLTQASMIYLGNNRFSGLIPSDLGNLTSLTNLEIQGNNLVGEIPGTLSDLIALSTNGLDLRWNGLYTGDSGLRDFLNSKQYGGDWESTQTISPTGLTTGEETHNSIKISWTPIQYQLDGGGYRVYYSTTSGSGYTLSGATADRTVDNYEVTDLDPATTYYFVVEAFTDSHPDNKNSVVSQYSSEVTADTYETPTLTITAPNGGENWEATTSQAITWTSTGNIDDVKIEYSIDNGTSWNIVIASTPNSGSFDWTIPNTPSGNCLVKISDIGELAQDNSDAVFTIAEQRTLTVTAPNGAENWEGNTDQTISWTYTGNIPNIKLEYSTNSGTTWDIITASAVNNGTYNWTVPNTPSNNCLVKVSDTAGPASDTTDAVFTIAEQRTLTVTAPNGGENWEGTISHNITWTHTGSIANVMLEYSTDNGNSWNTIAASTANSGSFNWTVPNNPSANCLVKASDTAGPASDNSDAVFTIAAQRTLTVTSPNGGENWEGTKSHNITWTSTGSIANVMLEYSTDNGSSWNTVSASTPNSGSYNWIVPNTPSANCLVKVSDTAGPASDTSDAVFTIAAQRTLTVTSPNGGENWEGTTSHNITWTHTGSIANVMLEYSTDNGSSWNTIAASTANSGSFNWTVPNTPSASCLVKVSDTAGSASDTSDAVFTIAAQRTLAITAPNGGENWEGTTSHNITWNHTGSIANVMLEYSTDNGGSWNTIAASTANSGSFNWTVPNTPSANCLVKIIDTAGPASDTSNAVFTIAAQRTLTVTAPNGSENWEGISSQIITWTHTGSIANVILEYSTDNGSSWNTIAASAASSGSFNWTVPNTPSANCLVKVSDTAGPASDTSNAVFTIAAQRTLAVTSPNGGENWEGTTSHNITWTHTGSIANVMLEYSTNNGSSWNTISASTANSGSFNWTVPNTPSTNCLVKISDTAGPASDTSDAVFTIAEYRTITLTTPNGGQRWFIGSTYAITWTNSGSIPNVMLEYSTDNGTSWNTIAGSTVNNGTYNWTIPNDPSPNCLVKVSDTSGPAFDSSNAVFTIDPFPTVTITTPNGGENWDAGTNYLITWNYTGTIDNVSIDYSTNGGSSWLPVTASTSNTGSYNWVTPVIDSAHCLVRVSDTSTSASDTSDGTFAIWQAPSITVTTPNGGESWQEGSIQNITWTSTGNIPNVKIELTVNKGGRWDIITTSAANTGTYQWTVTNVNNNKTGCLIRITAGDDSATDMSDGYFTILYL